MEYVICPVCNKMTVIDEEAGINPDQGGDATYILIGCSHPLPVVEKARAEERALIRRARNKRSLAATK